MDTSNFPVAFKWSLLDAVTTATPLDQALDGIAIHSDNWQALNLLREKYRERVKCIYIDPPYNTGGDGFAYKDSYQSASWLAMMEDRLRLGAETLQSTGVLFSSIDQNEYPRLRTLLERTLGSGNALGTIVWKNVTDNNPTNIAVEHEYVECFAKHRGMLESEWKNPYSDAKDLLIELGRELLDRHGDTPRLHNAYQEWLRTNKVFLGPLEGYKFIDGGGIYAGSRTGGDDRTAGQEGRLRGGLVEGTPARRGWSGHLRAGAIVRAVRRQPGEPGHGPDDGRHRRPPFEDAALALRYRLDRASHGLYCGIERFGSPFGYQLRQADGGGEAKACEVDLVESLAYLLGLDIERLYREPLGVVLLGRRRRGQTVGVFFRECADPRSADWVAAKLAQHPTDRVYTNDPAALTFPGGERLEAIEAAFALQFGRR